MLKRRFQVEGMHCVGCTMAIEGVLEDLPGVKSASANYARQVVVVEYDDSQTAETYLIAAIEDLGYAASVASPD